MPAKQTKSPDPVSEAWALLGAKLDASPDEAALALTAESLVRLSHHDLLEAAHKLGLAPSSKLRKESLAELLVDSWHTHLAETRQAAKSASGSGSGRVKQAAGSAAPSGSGRVKQAAGSAAPSGSGRVAAGSKSGGSGRVAAGSKSGGSGRVAAESKSSGSGRVSAAARASGSARVEKASEAADTAKVGRATRGKDDKKPRGGKNGAHEADHSPTGSGRSGMKIPANGDVPSAASAGDGVGAAGHDGAAGDSHPSRSALSHKFEVGEPGHPATAEARAALRQVSREIPWGYGHDRVTAMPVDPDRVFVYWEVLDGSIDRARGQLGPGGAGAWLNLRLYDVTGRVFDGTNAHSAVDHRVERSDRQWFLSVGRPTSEMIVEVGMKSHEGYFVKIARSGRLEFPRREPGAWSEPEWLTVRAAGSLERGGPHAYGRPGAGDQDPSGSLPPAGGFAGGVHTERREMMPWHDVMEVGQELGGGRMEREEWHEVDAGGNLEVHQRVWWEGPNTLTSWEAGPFVHPVEVPDPVRESFGGRTRIFRSGERTHVVYGPWQVVIRGLGAQQSRTVISRWEVHRSFSEETGGAVQETGGVTMPGASGRMAGASERRWVGASEVRFVGASEVYFIKASELRLGGASERMFMGASETIRRGASERRFAGASELRLGGASDRMLGGASEGLYAGASEHRPGGGSEPQSNGFAPSGEMSGDFSGGFSLGGSGAYPPPPGGGFSGNGQGGGERGGA